MKAHIVDASIGEGVRSERRRLGLTQAEAAARCGVGQTTWARYETGKHGMGAAVMAAFVALGANPSALLGRPPAAPQPTLIELMKFISTGESDPAPVQPEAPADLSGRPKDWMFVTPPVDLADLEARRDRLYRELTIVLMQIDTLRGEAP